MVVSCRCQSLVSDGEDVCTYELLIAVAPVCVCVCVCACARERERESERVGVESSERPQYTSDI